MKEPTHELKCWPQYFGPIEDGRKTFELRKNDRGYQTGDVLLLREWNPDALTELMGYTGNAMLVEVTYILPVQGMSEPWCVMAIKIVEGE